jgi:hypothetical protein
VFWFLLEFWASSDLSTFAKGVAGFDDAIRKCKNKTENNQNLNCFINMFLLVTFDDDSFLDRLFS